MHEPTLVPTMRSWRHRHQVVDHGAQMAVAGAYLGGGHVTRGLSLIQTRLGLCQQRRFQGARTAAVRLGNAGQTFTRSAIRF